MSSPTQNKTQNFHVPVEAESNAVDKQPTTVPNMTSAQQPAEKADRLRGGCFPCAVRSPFVFDLQFRVKRRTCSGSASPCFAASHQLLLYRHRRLKGADRTSQSCSPPSLYSLNYRYVLCIPELLRSRIVPFYSSLHNCSSLSSLVGQLPYSSPQAVSSLAASNSRTNRFPNHITYR